MTEKLLTSRELADALGFSPATIQDWSEAGRIPGFRVGGRLRFRASEVEAWLEGCRAGQEPLTYGSAGCTVSSQAHLTEGR